MSSIFLIAFWNFRNYQVENYILSIVKTCIIYYSSNFNIHTFFILPAFQPLFLTPLLRCPSYLSTLYTLQHY
nr:MAG TPA: hypothetical protein [Caudoviricetes sp.]